MHIIEKKPDGIAYFWTLTNFTLHFHFFYVWIHKQTNRSCANIARKKTQCLRSEKIYLQQFTSFCCRRIEISTHRIHDFHSKYVADGLLKHSNALPTAMKGKCFLAAACANRTIQREQQPALFTFHATTKTDNVQQTDRHTSSILNPSNSKVELRICVLYVHAVWASVHGCGIRPSQIRMQL